MDTMPGEQLPSFHQFLRLPAELRIKIWQDAAQIPSPRIHVFDVCLPSKSDSRYLQMSNGNGLDREIENENEVPDSVYLDRVAVPKDKNKTKSQNTVSLRYEHGHVSDPSAYTIRNSIRSSCFDASSSLPLESQDASSSNSSSNSDHDDDDDDDDDDDTNTVYLPLHNQTITYNNSTDILHLRFRPPSLSSPGTGPEYGCLDPNFSVSEEYYRIFKSPLSDTLSYAWSLAMVDTLQKARRVAVDIADLELEAPLGVYGAGGLYSEVGRFVAGLGGGIEVFYAVECRGENGYGRVRGDLALDLDPSDAERPPEVFYGNGVVYREVFDLERHGWTKEKPEFVVLQMFARAIREQQGERGAVCFQGVRVLNCRN